MKRRKFLLASASAPAVVLMAPTSLAAPVPEDMLVIQPAHQGQLKKIVEAGWFYTENPKNPPGSRQTVVGWEDVVRWR